MNLSYLKSFVRGLETNVYGKVRLSEKIIIIESDDWGAIRTPSNEALTAFKRKGFEIDKSIYKVDSLASKSDLEDLFDLLSSFKNLYGEHPIFTANAIMANPDFDRIRASEFKEFHFEPFNETFKKYPEHENNLQIWKRGKEEKLFHPQFHGREHLNVGRWMKDLLDGNDKVRFSFDYNSTYSGVGDYSFMGSYDWSVPEEIGEHEKMIIEGLKIFEETFGYKSNSFIAPCYNWDSQLEPLLAESGIKCIQGIRSQLAPTGILGKYNQIPHYFGEKNKYGTFYNVRNVFFEPVHNPGKDWTKPAMARIQAAFLMKRPAVISSHRVNYIGFIDPKNKENGLRQLGSLLKQILKKWPDVRFVTTDQLISYFSDNDKN
jgi:hypothetical protein